MGHAPQLDPCGIGGGAMSGFDIKGWCPGALRPMASGDGLVLRIRKNGDWETRALMPDDNRDLKTIAEAVAKEMADAGYVLDTTDGEGFVPAVSGTRQIET